MALWRLKGEIVFGTAQGRTTFLSNHDTWRGSHTLLVDIVRSLNSENSIALGNYVRFDVVASPESETEAYFNALRALPTTPWNRAFLSLHRCAVDQIPQPNETYYFEFQK